MPSWMLLEHRYLFTSSTLAMEFGRHMEIYCKQWGCRRYNDWNYTTVVYYMFSE